MSAPPLHIDGQSLEANLATLATFSSAEAAANGTAVTRIVFSDHDLRARRWLRSLALAAGLTVREDAVGNTFFRLQGTDPALPAVATGSHIDAIPHAGMFDGTVGVLGGLEALRAIAATGVQPRRSLELILFTSEEPTRFGIGCLGSRLLAGALDPVRAAALRDAQDRTLDAVRTDAGFAGSLAGVRVAAGQYAAFVELHIEQGPLLERSGNSIGIVTGIAAPASYRFVIEGLGGHAGALLMPDRQDALCAAAEVILAAESCALATGSIDTVATVGTCAVHPGAVNSVPSRVTLELDLRDTSRERRDAVIHAIRAQAQAIGARRAVSIVETEINADAPATSDPALTTLLATLCERQGTRYQRMVSRAYHDALFMAAIAPVAMLFIPCRAGVSHRPDEFADSSHIAQGTQLLAECLAELAAAP